MRITGGMYRGRKIGVPRGDREVHRTTLANVTALAGEGQQVVCCPVERWLRLAGRGLAAGLVFADPPYSRARETGLAELAAQVARERVVAVGGLLIAELPRQAPTDTWPGWRLLRDRVYGHTRLVIGQLMEHAS